jgi:hypothetical protein
VDLILPENPANEALPFGQRIIDINDPAVIEEVSVWLVGLRERVPVGLEHQNL